MASLFKTEIKKLKGVGPKTEKCLNNLGVNTIGDIINFYPCAISQPQPTRICKSQHSFANSFDLPIHGG